MAASFIGAILGSLVVVSTGVTEVFVATRGDQFRMIKVVDDKYLFDVGMLSGLNANWQTIRNSPTCVAGGPGSGCVIQQGRRQLSVKEEMNTTNGRSLAHSDSRFSRVCYTGESNTQNPYNFAGITAPQYQLTAGVVKLHMRTATGQADSCTAWRVQPGDIPGRNEQNLFLTASHCFENLDDISQQRIEVNYEQVNCDGVVSQNGPWGPIKQTITIPLQKLIKRGGGGDLFRQGLDYALFTVDPNGIAEVARRGVQFPYVPMSNANFLDNEHIYISGHGYGAPKQISAQYTDQGNDHHCHVTQTLHTRVYYYCPIARGSSGAPIISSNDNTVKALLMGKYDGDLNYGVKINDVRSHSTPLNPPQLHRYRYRQGSNYIWAACATCMDTFVHWERFQLQPAGYSDSKELVEGFITENVPIPEFVQDGELRDDVRFFTVPAEILDDDDRRLEMSSLRKSPVPSSGGCILGHCKVCCKLSSTTAATTTTFDDCLSQSAKYPSADYPVITERCN